MLRTKSSRFSTVFAVSQVALIGVLTSPAGWASDIIRLTSSAGSEGAAGVSALSPTPQTALLANPALLSRMDDGMSLTLTALAVDSDFTSQLGEVSAADSGPGLFPEFGIKGSLDNSKWQWGAAATIQSALLADFSFTDPPGTADVSYGLQRHRSEWLIAKLGAALSYDFSDRLSAGLTVGLAYNRNELEAPYIFQSHPVLRGLKVLVDLSADDVAFTSVIGLTYAARPDVDFSVSYSLRSDFSADGNLVGNLGQLGLGIEETFTYAANVETALPAIFIAGLSWRANEQLTLGLQWDRVHWENSFATLPVRLTAGSNAELNAFLGEDVIFDTAPLLWEDQDSLHLGAEYLLTSGTTLRAGYERTEPPVPGRTFTPLTGAIFDRAYTLGAGFTLNNTRLDLAYRISTGDDIQVGNSALASGEYANTSQSLTLHSLVLSLGF